MLHTHIENEEIVERYVRKRLTPDERQAFEEHYLACDECFQKVQAMDRFIAGIQDLARRGELDDAVVTHLSRRVPGWTMWAFAASSLAVIALGAMAGWAYLDRIPMLQRELQAASTHLPVQSANVSRPQPESPEANVPVAVLLASRGQEATTAVLAPSARQLVVWAEIGATRYHSYGMEVYSESGTRIMTVDGLTRGPYGAFAASLPTEQLHPGTFRITLTGQSPPPASIVGEYRLQIRRP